MINWGSLDLDGWEISLPLIDGLSFSEFLLALDGSCSVVTADGVRKQFEEELLSRVEDAREVLEANLSNIVIKANKTKNES
jgi:hypothetical protein